MANNKIPPKLLQRLRARQDAITKRNQQELNRAREFGVIRQGSIRDNPLVDLFAPQFFSNEPNLDPITEIPNKGFGHFLTSGFSNSIANGLSIIDALAMLGVGGAIKKPVTRFFRNLGETGAVNPKTVGDIISNVKKKVNIPNSDDALLEAKQDMAKLVDPFLPDRDKVEAFQRLKSKKQISNEALSQMPLKDQKQVIRALEKRRK